MDKLEKYIEGVLNGDIPVGNLMYQAVQRFNKLRVREDIYFDEEVVQECIDFIALIKHFLGKSAGQSFILEPWQVFIVANIMGLKYKSNGYRVCRESLILVSRKAGKDAFIAALSLYMLIVDGEASPQIACLANTREQARILFEYIDKFSKGLDKKEKFLKHFRNYINMSLNEGSVKVFSSDASTLDGLNISCGVIDEFHAAKDRNLYDVIKSSMGMRTQPLMIVISTAGFNLDGPCYDMWKLAVEVLGGIKKDDGFFPFIFQMNENDDIEDENNWIKCQPNLDVTVSREFMRSELQKMKNDTTSEVGIKTKTFNMWCTSSMVWIKPEEIVACMQDIKLEDFIGYTGVMGVDLASVNDLSAISLMINGENNKKYFFNWSFLPEETFENSPLKPLYEKFVKEGSLILTPGNILDVDYIINKIIEINSIIPITTIYFDRYNATSWSITLTEKGFNLEPFSQSIGNYNAPTKEFHRLVLERKAVIQKSSNFVWQISCVTIKEDSSGNIKPIKLSWQTEKIDSVIACTTALGGYLKQGGGNNDFTIFSM